MARTHDEEGKATRACEYLQARQFSLNDNKRDVLFVLCVVCTGSYLPGVTQCGSCVQKVGRCCARLEGAAGWGQLQQAGSKSGCAQLEKKLAEGQCPCVHVVQVAAALHSCPAGAGSVCLRLVFASS